MSDIEQTLQAIDATCPVCRGGCIGPENQPHCPHAGRLIVSQYWCCEACQMRWITRNAPYVYDRRPWLERVMERERKRILEQVRAMNTEPLATDEVPIDAFVDPEPGSENLDEEPGHLATVGAVQTLRDAIDRAEQPPWWRRILRRAQ